jgi:predicted HicB family RNase H-like nuclease
MNTLKYKGYIGSVAYSEPDKVFFGKIEGIDGLVNYEGESVQELTSAFQEAVDDYLIFCQEHNVKPEKSYTGTFNVRIPPATHRDIANIAAEAGISINAFVKKALCDAVRKPWVKPDSLLPEYSYDEPEHIMVMEPSEKYGSTATVKLTIPQKDLAFAKELLARFAWNME